jgi:hypothetical protein
MAKKQLTIDDLLNSLQNPNKKLATLPNTPETWAKIGNKDAFSELGMDNSELNEFLKEWVADNPYNNI